jgi:hypothetical protein
MIVTKTVNFDLNQFNSNHFRRLGYDVVGNSVISIDIKDLGFNSSLKVEVECDVCQRQKFISYRKYNKNIKKYNIYTCSNKCAMVKNEKTCLEKFGVKYPLQSSEIMENLKGYFFDKFGVDNPSKLDSNKLKREKTMIEKFGVKTNLILPETHKKAVMLSYSEESIEKRKKTNNERFGVDNPMKSDIVYRKFKKTNLSKYGCEFPAQNSEIFLKTQKSGLKIKEYKGINYQGTYELDFLKKLEGLNLLDKLDNRITSSLAKRLDTLDDLSEKLEASSKDYEKNPTDDNRKSYNEVMEYVKKFELAIISDLEALLTKRKAEELAKETPATPEAPPATPEAPVTPPAKSEEKKDGSGILTLVIGGVLLVASFGAINYFRKQ